MILSVTNKCEIEMSISFESIEIESDLLKNVSSFTPNAEISFETGEGQEVQIDRQDNARSQSASLRPEDLSTNGFVCFRRDNKIAILCKVRPLLARIDKEKSPNVRVAFLVKHLLDPKAVMVDSSASISPPVTQRSTVAQKIFIDLGPLRLEDGFKIIPRPKYIEDCLSGVKK